MSEFVLIEKMRPGLVVVTLNRPERRNALSIDLMKQLLDQWKRLESDQQTRVAILRGAGPVFCAGLDLAEAENRELVRESAQYVARTLSTLRYSNLVSIALLHGAAYAGGAGVIAACDMAIGSNDCKIGFPEARRGLLPALISDVLRTKLREGDLSELFLVGDPINAQRAQAMGLLQRVVAHDELLDQARKMAESILAGGPETIRQTKKLLHHAYRHQAPPPDQFSQSIDEHLKARFSEEASEGLRAFLEKRPANWIIN